MSARQPLGASNANSLQSGMTQNNSANPTSSPHSNTTSILNDPMAASSTSSSRFSAKRVVRPRQLATSTLPSSSPSSSSLTSSSSSSLSSSLQQQSQYQQQQHQPQLQQQTQQQPYHSLQSSASGGRLSANSVETRPLHSGRASSSSSTNSLSSSGNVDRNQLDWLLNQDGLNFTFNHHFEPKPKPSTATMPRTTSTGSSNSNSMGMNMTSNSNSNINANANSQQSVHRAKATPVLTSPLQADNSYLPGDEFFANILAPTQAQSHAQIPVPAPRPPSLPLGPLEESTPRALRKKPSATLTSSSSASSFATMPAPTLTSSSSTSSSLVSSSLMTSSATNALAGTAGGRVQPSPHQQQQQQQQAHGQRPLAALNSPLGQPPQLPSLNSSLRQSSSQSTPAKVERQASRVIRQSSSRTATPTTTTAAAVATQSAESDTAAPRPSSATLSFSSSFAASQTQLPPSASSTPSPALTPRSTTPPPATYTPPVLPNPFKPRRLSSTSSILDDSSDLFFGGHFDGLYGESKDLDDDLEANLKASHPTKQQLQQQRASRTEAQQQYPQHPPPPPPSSTSLSLNHSHSFAEYQQSGHAIAKPQLAQSQVSEPQGSVPQPPPPFKPSKSPNPSRRPTIGQEPPLPPLQPRPMQPAQHQYQVHGNRHDLEPQEDWDRVSKERKEQADLSRGSTHSSQQQQRLSHSTPHGVIRDPPPSAPSPVMPIRPKSAVKTRAVGSAASSSHSSHTSGAGVGSPKVTSPNPIRRVSTNNSASASPSTRSSSEFPAWYPAAYPPAPPAVLYTDDYITVSSLELTIHSYYFPTNTPLTVPLVSISELATTHDMGSLGWLQYKTWGTSLNNIWWALDHRRMSLRGNGDRLLPVPPPKTDVATFSSPSTSPLLKSVDTMGSKTKSKSGGVVTNHNSHSSNNLNLSSREKFERLQVVIKVDGDWVRKGFGVGHERGVEILKDAWKTVKESELGLKPLPSLTVYGRATEASNQGTIDFNALSKTLVVSSHLNPVAAGPGIGVLWRDHDVTMRIPTGNTLKIHAQPQKSYPPEDLDDDPVMVDYDMLD